MESENQTNVITLLPCPFCGSEAQIHYDANGSKWVACENRECAIQPYLYRTKRTEAEAVEAWNTRAERTCQIVMDGSLGKCSACGDECFGDAHAARYCPNCGAEVVSE